MPEKPNLDIQKAGSQVGTIPVIVDYRIIDIFSAQLYSSPAKAIEELVVNSYDAFAENCQVIIPEDWGASDGRVLVWDDGESMDLQGLRELWLVADSYKRDPDRENAAKKRGRLPVGKFGIGKLASYVLGQRISHVCKRGNQILVVTMDYSDVVPSESSLVAHQLVEPKKLSLEVRSLNEKEAKELLGYAVSGDLPGRVKLPLFGAESPPSWTLVVIDHLKEDRKRIQKGRLEWIIATALPLVPNFKVFLNGNEIPPSKLDLKVIHTWNAGENDSVAQELGYYVGAETSKPKPFNSWVNIPGIGNVSGEFTLYESSLITGKASENGRSHGFFIMVRNRLINHDEPLFGIHALSHATFNRFRAVIYADGLDKTLVANRESVSEQSRLILEKYLLSKFNDIRNWYENWLIEEEKRQGIPERLASVPGALARFPLKHAVDRAVTEKEVVPRTIKTPPKGEPIEDVIRLFELAALDPAQPIAVFDASNGIVKININHPYYINFSDSQTHQSMEVLAAAEVLLEAYLLDTTLSPDEVDDIVNRRDQLLRALVQDRPISVTIIARQLRDSVTSVEGSENSCHQVFRSLGFDVVPLGGPGKPDGIATAHLAVRYGRKVGEVDSRAYKVTYDAKSSIHEKVKSGNLSLSAVSNHRDKWGADYAVVVAPGFEDTKGDESKAVEEAVKQDVCLIRARDFADLIEASGVKPLPLESLEELFKLNSPQKTRDWIEGFRAEKNAAPLHHIRLVLDIIYKLQKERPMDPPSWGAIQSAHPALKEISERQIREWVLSLSRLQPDLISLYADKVELHSSPEVIVRHFQQSLKEIEKK